MKPITPEQARILRAAAEGRLVRNEAYRLVIHDEARPARRDRERLQGRRMLTRDHVPVITRYGELALRQWNREQT